MFSYTIGQLAKATNAEVVGDTNRSITSVSIDSRNPVNGAQVAFFALKGERHDGHNYISDLYNYQGIRVFIVADSFARLHEYPEATFLRVKNTLEALQGLASDHRLRFRYPVIGITGSNGKTIVKEWLGQTISADHRVVRSPKSFNSQVGVPLSVLQMDGSFDLAIFEAGISKPQEMERLEPIIAPDIGIFTNIGLAHQENFSNLGQKVQEKLKLFTGVKELIYCKDHTLIDTAVEKHIDRRVTRITTWGHSPGSDVVLHEAQVGASTTRLMVSFKGQSIEFSIPFTDSASIENAMHCLAALLILKVDAASIPRRMERLTPVAMRLELKEAINGCTLINDSYNSDIGSLTVALDFLLQQKQHPRRMLILSDILQSGRKAETLYAEVAKLVGEKGVDQLVGIGNEISQYHHLFRIDGEFYPDTQSFIANFNRRQVSNTAILLKGSRPFHFERIASVLERKTHRTIMEVNLSALVHNLNYYKSLLKPGVKLMALVKAFSYGSGSFEIANLLQFHRVDYLGVAFADEGVALREAGISLPIIVLNPSFGTYELMIEYNLEPEIYSLTGLTEFYRVIERTGVSSYPIHLKLDTGMHRLGFSEADLDDLLINLQGNGEVKVKTIFSHLAASDEDEHDEFTGIQIARFESMTRRITTALGYPVVRHILNSAGIERFPNAQYEMVRLGIGLYGISTTCADKLLNVNTLKSKVIQVKTINKGETVGYSRRGVISRVSTIATIPIGYADGLNRRLSNGVGQVLLKGKLVPIVGNISMDTCMIDATGIDVKEGDEVVIFGDKPSIIAIAQAIGTIPYEILTSISRRVKRVYIQE